MATLDSDQRSIARRKRMAEMLMQQGSIPLDTNQMAGGYVVPVSPLAGIAKVAQQLSGAYLGKKADEEESDLEKTKMAVVQQLYSGKETPTIQQIAASGIASPSELMTMAAADRAEQQKVHREGIPTGFNATPGGGIAPMSMANGSDYGQFLLQQAGAKAQQPSYGDQVKIALAQDANAMAHQKLEMEKAEQNRKALEALKPAIRLLPTHAIDKITKQQAIQENTDRLNSTFKPEYGGHTVAGGLSNTVGRIMGDESGQPQWWQDYQTKKNTVRNTMFGGALTPTEQEEWEESDINPRMDSKQIKLNLQRQADIEAAGYARILKNYKKGGYDVSEFEIPPANANFEKVTDPQAEINALRNAGDHETADKLQQMVNEQSKKSKPEKAGLTDAEKDELEQLKKRFGK